MDRLVGLTVEQKLDLVQKELEDTRDEIRHMRANAERDLQHHEVSSSLWVLPLCLWVSTPLPVLGEKPMEDEANGGLSFTDPTNSYVYTTVFKLV